MPVIYTNVHTRVAKVAQVVNKSDTAPDPAAKQNFQQKNFLSYFETEVLAFEKWKFRRQWKRHTSGYARF